LKNWEETDHKGRTFYWQVERGNKAAAFDGGGSSVSAVMSEGGMSYWVGSGLRMRSSLSLRRT
jgi:hypothetical protein